MKVIIDLIEDIRTAISNEKSFSLVAMGLEENDAGEFLPVWEANISSMKVDDEQKRLFLFLGKTQFVSIGDLLEEVNALSNEKMMHEVCVSYSKDDTRLDSALLGFGESLEDKKYLLFLPA